MSNFIYVILSIFVFLIILNLKYIDLCYNRWLSINFIFNKQNDCKIRPNNPSLLAGSHVTQPISLFLIKQPKTITFYDIPSELKDIIIGLGLGDLYIRRRNKNTCLCFKQSLKHEEYIMHIYSLFQEYCKMSPRIKDAVLNEKTHQSIYFDTLTYEAFNYYHELFYKNKTKIVPRNIQELLTAKGLATWVDLKIIFTYDIIYLVILFCVWFIFDLDLFQVFFSYGFFYCYLAGIPIISSNNLQNITPVKHYSNADKEKKLIYDENKNKCGVYCWINFNNNKYYVGGSSNLSKRFSWYYNLIALSKLMSSSLIVRALLKYGYSGFSLSIL
uniref:GIY-YIG domain-containing protein n=1 Tax=Orbilia brochopaga TaxID=3140254 RepID=A0A4Y5MZU0_9PEZI|nr:hypothetical protein [Drechslerella brochopaga]